MLLSFKRKKRSRKREKIRNKDKSYIDSYQIEKPVEIELKEYENSADNIIDCKDISNDIRSMDNNLTGFSEHMEKYIGETVTVFTTSGGESGSGFTGVLLSSNEEFISILSKIGPAPYTQLHRWSHGLRNYYNMLKYNFAPYTYNPIYSVGSITNIRTKHIAAFVHNTV